MELYCHYTYDEVVMNISYCSGGVLQLKTLNSVVLEIDANIVEKHAASIFRFSVCVCVCVGVCVWCVVCVCVWCVCVCVYVCGVVWCVCVWCVCVCGVCV